MYALPSDFTGSCTRPRKSLVAISQYFDSLPDLFGSDAKKLRLSPMLIDDMELLSPLKGTSPGFSLTPVLPPLGGELTLPLGSNGDKAKIVTSIDTLATVIEEPEGDRANHLACIGTTRRRRHSSWAEIVNSPWLMQDDKTSKTSSNSHQLDNTIQEPATATEVQMVEEQLRGLSTVGAISGRPLSTDTPHEIIFATDVNSLNTTQPSEETPKTVPPKYHLPSIKNCSRFHTNVSTTSRVTPMIQKKRNLKICPYCNKRLETKYKLDRHIRTHTGERPFECECCKSRFNQKSSLKTHSTIHAKAVLRDPNSTKLKIESYRINGYSFEDLGIPYAGYVFDAIKKNCKK